MTTRLNKHSCDFAQDRIKDGKVVHDERDDWSEHQPSTRQENRFIEANGWDEYANWHLGIDDEASSTPRPGTSTHTATSGRCTDAGYSPRRYGRDATSTPTSKTPRFACAT
jgi:hypothetical protein